MMLENVTFFVSKLCTKYIIHTTYTLSWYTLQYWSWRNNNQRLGGNRLDCKYQTLLYKYSSLLRPVRGAEYCGHCGVCVRTDISRTTSPIFTKFLCAFPMAMARSCSGAIAIRYLYLLLWMTSRFPITGCIAYFNTTTSCLIQNPKICWIKPKYQQNLFSLRYFWWSWCDL